MTMTWKRSRKSMGLKRFCGADGETERHYPACGQEKQEKNLQKQR
jgi:hypothetical protein